MIQQAFINGFRLTSKLWWVLVLQIVLSLGSVSATLLRLYLGRSGPISFVIFIFSLILAVINLGMLTAKTVFMDRYTNHEPLSKDIVFATIKQQANRLIAPAFYAGCLIAILGFLAVILLVGAHSSLVKTSPLTVNPAVNGVFYIIRIIFTSLFSTFPIYFALEKTPFILSCKRSIAYAVGHRKMSLALSIISAGEIAIELLASQFLSAQILQWFKVIVISCLGVYFSAVNYEYWKSGIQQDHEPKKT